MSNLSLDGFRQQQIFCYKVRGMLGGRVGDSGVWGWVESSGVVGLNGFSMNTTDID